MAEKIPQPKWILYVRAARALLAVIVLGLCAYTIQIAAMVQAQFAIFVSIFTFLVTIYLFVSEISVPQAYNRWIVLVLEIVTLIFWLSAFSSLGALAANVDACLDMAEAYGTWCYTVRYLDKRDLSRRAGIWDNETARGWYGCLAGASGIGAIIFILSIVTVVIFCMALQKHRRPVASSAVGDAAVPMHNTMPPAGGVPEKVNSPGPISPQQAYIHPQHVSTPPPSGHASMPPGYMQQQQPQPIPSQYPSPIEQQPQQPIPHQYSGPTEHLQHQQAQQYQQQQAPGHSYPEVPPNHSELSAAGAEPGMPQGQRDVRS